MSDAPGNWCSSDVIATLGLPTPPQPGDFAARVDAVKTRALWNLRARAREAMIEDLRGRGLAVADSDALWLGCAGDGSVDARPQLLLRDLARLERLLDDPLNAVRLAILGPVPAPVAEALAELSVSARFEGRIAYLPGPDLEVARTLVQGVDLWLSLARPGATQVSGVAAEGGDWAAQNGALNLASAAGVWAERGALLPEVGWALGGARAFDDDDAQDEHDARVLYELLEREVVPAFYDWDNEGVPQRWVAKIRSSLRAVPSLA